MIDRRLAASALLGLLLAAPALAEDWNQWRGPARDGVAPGSPPLIEKLERDGLPRVWASEAMPSGFDGGWSSPVVSGGKVYVMSHAKTLRPGLKKPGKRQFPWLAPDKRGHLTPQQYAEYEVNRRNEDEAIAKAYVFTETLYCFDAASGSTLWKNRKESVYTRFVMSGTPTVTGGKVYFLGAARTLRCVEATSGKNLWETLLPGDFRDEYFMSSVAVHGGVAAVFCDDLFGVHAETGEILWKQDAARARGTHTSPVGWSAADGRATFIANVNDGADKTACFDAKTGQELWRVDSGARQSTPLVVGNRLLTYGSSRKSGLRCYEVSAQSAEPLWTYQGVADSGSSPVVSGDHVYVHGGIHVACVDLKTGAEKWKDRLIYDNPRYTSPIAADGKILYAWDGLLCYRADPSGFHKLFDGKLNREGLMAAEDDHRRLLDLEGKEAKAAEKIYNAQVRGKGAAICTTPALADGRIYIRTASGVVCHDLRRSRKDN